ncbi:WD domain-containing protein [Microdochium trichocladiopsis]|uniref:WD domain-containing protein n=1 Tax=Microdochium trichocladiopsis TaxID=1682393 RepID=A0A9P8YK14_9PEZI|nr:WD domain-containing protein [Microdochium trichocladiopsis]KAH7041377.1 WD domain-containing protein [Microdochium trichocladiopsis]
MPENVMSKTVTPFLREHIPTIYAPVGKPSGIIVNSARKDPNSKFCYRHRPDSKCRKAADESKMAVIQSSLETLPDADRQAITNVWSLFSAAPTKHRDLMLQGILTQCCFPQLSTVARELGEQLKIDFIAALPDELSLKVLSYLDCVSLCKAARVSRRWNTLSCDDIVWHRLCTQHINRKCTHCGWGLPKLEKKRLKEWRPQRLVDIRPSGVSATAPAPAPTSEPTAAPALPLTPATIVTSPGKRSACSDEEEENSKRACISGVGESAGQELARRYRPWKDVYRDRFKVGSNWKYGRCSVKIFRGQHTNGVTCLQFDDNILATGSYDSTIKLWDIEKGEVIRTLQGHTSGIRALQFDDRVLVSGSLDGTVKIWNWRTGRCLKTLDHQGGVVSVHMEGDLLASGSMDKTIKIFNFRTGVSWSLRGHTDWVNQVRLDTASNTLLSASDDCTVKMWDLDTCKVIKTYEGHVGQVQQVLPLPDDFEFEDEHGNEVDLATVASPRSNTPPPSASNDTTAVNEERAAYGPAFENDPTRQLPPRFMLTGSLDATMRLWDTATGKTLRPFFGHVEGIWALSGDTLRFVTGANDATVKIWEPKAGKCERTFTGHAGPVTCVGLSDARMASGGEDGEVRLYSFADSGSHVEERGTPS